MVNLSPIYFVFWGIEIKHYQILLTRTLSHHPWTDLYLLTTWQEGLDSNGRKQRRVYNPNIKTIIPYTWVIPLDKHLLLLVMRISLHIKSLLSRNSSSSSFIIHSIEGYLLFSFRINYHLEVSIHLTFVHQMTWMQQSWLKWSWCYSCKCRHLLHKCYARVNLLATKGGLMHQINPSLLYSAFQLVLFLMAK